MDLNQSESCIEAEDNLDLLDLSFFDSTNFFDDLNGICKGLKSILKWRRRSDGESLWDRLQGKQQPRTPVADERQKMMTTKKKKKKTVAFREPLCDVRLYDKVAAKRQQWGHATKFCRVKRFCWDKDTDLETALRSTKDDLWLLEESQRQYRQMLLRDMQKRRQNRKRRQNGEELEFMVQRLEISPNCVETVRSKMRRLAGGK